jgi:hypothetical protein
MQDALNTYRVCVTREDLQPLRSAGIGRIELVETITFPSTPELPPPSANYIALHATCCRIAALSGATDHFVAVEEDFDAYRGMPFSGVSGEALDSLSRFLEFGIPTNGRSQRYCDIHDEHDA